MHLLKLTLDRAGWEVKGAPNEVDLWSDYSTETNRTCYYLQVSMGAMHDPRRSAMNYRKTKLASCEAPSQHFVRELNSGLVYLAGVYPLVGGPDILL
jgi:hypothetical protein